MKIALEKRIMDKNQKKPPQAEDDIDILVCARTQDSADSIKGSIWDKCRECGASVWISPSGQRAMGQNKKLVPFCIECAYHKNKGATDMEVQLAPGSLQELRNYLATRKKH